MPSDVFCMRAEKCCPVCVTDLRMEDTLLPPCRQFSVEGLDLWTVNISLCLLLKFKHSCCDTGGVTSFVYPALLTSRLKQNFPSKGLKYAFKIQNSLLCVPVRLHWLRFLVIFLSPQPNAVNIIQESLLGVTAAFGVSNQPAFLRSALSPFIVITLGDTDEGEEVGLWNAGWFVPPHVAVSPKRFYWILSPRKLQDSKRFLKLVRVAFIKSVVCHSCHTTISLEAV